METKNEIDKMINEIYNLSVSERGTHFKTDKELMLETAEATEKRVYEEILEHTGLFCGNCLKQLKKLKEQKLGGLKS
jgi:hypothetical protein